MRIKLKCFDMPINEKNLVQHELIGLKVEVVESKNSSLVGLRGEIMNETKNTFLVAVRKKVKHVPKRNNTFSFSLGRRQPFKKVALKRKSVKTVRVNGNILVARPEDRIKIKVKKWC